MAVWTEVDSEWDKSGKPLIGRLVFLKIIYPRNRLKNEDNEMFFFYLRVFLRIFSKIETFNVRQFTFHEFIVKWFECQNELNSFFLTEVFQ